MVSGEVQSLGRERGSMCCDGNPRKVEVDERGVGKGEVKQAVGVMGQRLDDGWRRVE